MKSESPTALHVVCLCAAWCGVCRQYETEFHALQQQWPQVRFAWVDVEDQADVMGEVDVETFPTLLIANTAQALFMGPLLPQIKVLDRMIATFIEGAPASATLDPQAQQLWERVRAQ